MNTKTFPRALAQDGQLMERIIDGAANALIEAELAFEQIPSMNWKWAVVDVLFIAALAFTYRG